MNIRQFTFAVIVAVVVLRAQDPSRLPLPSAIEHGAQTGDTAACVQQAVQYWWGIERAANRDSACQLAARCAAHDPLAAFVYAECLADPRASLPNERHADSILATIFPLLQERAQAGNTDALIGVSEYYRRGLGKTIPNDDSATRYLQRALQAGNAVAAYLLARDLSSERDGSQRWSLLRRATEGKVVAAMLEWARLLLTDTACIAEAIALLRQAEQRGSAEAALLLGACAQQGVGMEQSTTDALRWIAIAADRGSVTAQLELSVRLLHGIGLPADTVAALQWALQALSSALPQQRRVVLDYVRIMRDSFPTVFRHLEEAVTTIAKKSAAHDRLLSKEQLVGSGVRLWHAFWQPSVVVPSLLALRQDGRALIATAHGVHPAFWRFENAQLLVRDEEHEDTATVVVLTNGWCALRWRETLALYAPVTSDQRRQDTLFRYHPFFRPHVEMLPPRVGEYSVRLRIKAVNVPRSGLVLFPLGVATDRTARTAQRAVGVSQLWRVWDDGITEVVWEPRAEDFPERSTGTYVLFVQCSWQFEGEDETMVVKSQPFALPRQRGRR